MPEVELFRCLGKVERFLVAHGQGSDPSRTGYATRFSNENETHATSLGFFRTAETYDGKHGYSLRLDGLSATNSNARERAIVIHGADYVASLGRSWGCPAVEMSVRTRLIDMLKGGSVILAAITHREIAQVRCAELTTASGLRAATAYRHLEVSAHQLVVAARKPPRVRIVVAPI